MTATDHPDTARAVVLGGGGSKGAYQIGVWQALRELGLGYRVVTGCKQQMSLHEQVARAEIVPAMGLVPVKLLRKHTPDADIGMRCDCRSWKEQSKCRKSWQRRSGQPSARKLHEDEWAKYLEEQAYSVEEEDADLLQAG